MTNNEPDQINALQQSINAWAVRKEWRGPNSAGRSLVVDLALFTSEISEALEELRKNSDPHHYYESYAVTVQGVKFSNLSAEQVEVITGAPPEDLNLTGKPEGFGPELADLMIRVLETAEEYNFDMSYEIERKMAYNEKREIRHGGLLM